MKPKKSLIERAEQNGTMYRANILISAAHLATGIANNLYSEAGDLLQGAGIHLGEIKKLFNNLQLAADRYFADFATMVTGEEVKKAFFTDLDEYTTVFRHLVGVEDGFTPAPAGEWYRPDIRSILDSKQKMLAEHRRMEKELEQSIERINGKLHLAKFGLTPGQYFTAGGVRYANAQSDGTMLYAHRVKKNGDPYKDRQMVIYRNEDEIKPENRFIAEEVKE